MNYTVRCLDLGRAEIRGPELFWMSDWDTWHPLQFLAVLIQGGDVTALVNTSPPDNLSEIHRRFPDLPWPSPTAERGRLVRNDDELMEPALAKVGLRPSDVTHVLLTPLELYTTSMLPLFSSAEICMTRRGWVHFHTTHEHPHDRRWRSFSPEILVHLVTEAWDRVRLLDDEDEVASGLRTWWSGVHHRASMVVEADTKAGVIAISDSFFYYENVEDNRLLGLNENMYEAEPTNARVRRTAAHVIPIHDPKVFCRYPEGIVVG